MSSERRQDLQSNLLADRLEESILSIKPYLKWILAAIAALIIGSIVYGVWQSMSEKRQAEAWSELYFSSGRPDKLPTVYEDFPQTPAGLWARQTEADSLMARGLEAVYLDRDLSDELFSQAEEGYRAVLKKAQEPMLISRATLGLAQALDSEGKADEAVKEYKKLVSMKAIHRELAEDVERRVAFIQSSEGKEFFEWYATNRPTAPKPVDIPGNLNQLPGLPDLKFTPPAGSSPAGSSTAPAADDAATLKFAPVPSDSKAEMKETTGDATKPAEAPSSEAKPEETKPAPTSTEPVKTEPAPSTPAADVVKPEVKPESNPTPASPTEPAPVEPAK